MLSAEDSFDWAALGLARPQAIKLDAGQRSRLAHMAEFRDIDSPSAAARASAEFAGERWFSADLLSVRPWIASDTPRREVLSAILDTQWTGFLALLGEYGPWVYANGVSDLQRLSGLYGKLVAEAFRASEAVVYRAAQGREGSLLTRLEATDYRQPTGQSADLAALERVFWEDATAQARAAYDAWQSRRR